MKRMKYILALGLIVLNQNLYSQLVNVPEGVSIANVNVPPSKNAMLDVVSTEKGMLVPRVAFSVINDASGKLHASKILGTEDGLLVFVTTPAQYGYWYFDDNAVPKKWRKLGINGVEIMTWVQMHDLVVTEQDRGRLVFVTDCQYKCNSSYANTNVRGLYYFNGFGFSNVPSVPGGCTAVNRWVRVTDGFTRPKCFNPAGGLCPMSPSDNGCTDYYSYNNLDDNQFFQFENQATFAQLSDSTFKKDVVILTNAIDKLQQINGVYYNWKDENADQSRQLGVIAQDVQKVFPEAVGQTVDGKLGVRYELLVAPLIEAMKEQQKIIEDQQKQINLLINRIEKLEKK